MKILIGITQQPEQTKAYLRTRYGDSGSMTEVGPFVSLVDALNWLVYLKSMIGDFEEIIPKNQSGEDVLWFGFAYEGCPGNMTCTSVNDNE